ncbi:MAG: hypothetical protein ABI082_12550 [Dokdonella sp.]
MTKKALNRGALDGSGVRRDANVLDNPRAMHGTLGAMKARLRAITVSTTTTTIVVRVPARG